MFNLIVEKLAKLEAAFIATVMLVISVLVFAQVLTRYVFQYSTPWLEELTRFLMIWMVMIGAAYAVRTRSHIVVNALDTMIPSPRIAKSVRLLVCALCLGFSVILSILAYTVVQRSFAFGQLSGAMRLPMYYANGSFLAAGILLSVHYLHDFVGLLHRDPSQIQDVQ